MVNSKGILLTRIRFQDGIRPLCRHAPRNSILFCNQIRHLLDGADSLRIIRFDISAGKCLFGRQQMLLSTRQPHSARKSSPCKRCRPSRTRRGRRSPRARAFRYTLKTPYRDGTTHVIFEPEDFIARLAALVPKPRAHLTRYHSVFAPPSPDRAQIVPSAVVHVGRSHARVRRPAD